MGYTCSGNLSSPWPRLALWNPLLCYAGWFRPILVALVCPLSPSCLLLDSWPYVLPNLASTLSILPIFGIAWVAAMVVLDL